MFGKKKQNQKDNSLNFRSDSYIMKDNYETDNLVVANLEFVSNEMVPNGPMIIQTEQKYLFEKICENGRIRYREIFTGFIADADESCYFNLPYVVNVVSLKDQVTSISDVVTKYGLLLVLNDVNTEKLEKNYK